MRSRMEIPEDAIIDLLERGATASDIAEEFECTPTTIRSRIVEIQKEQSLLLQYRQIQSLQLTKLQMQILEKITPDKIDEAPLRDLVLAFKVLKDKEHVIEGKPSDIKGLVSYLIDIEKEEAGLKTEPVAIDADYESEEEDDLPNM